MLVRAVFHSRQELGIIPQRSTSKDPNISTWKQSEALDMLPANNTMKPNGPLKRLEDECMLKYKRDKRSLTFEDEGIIYTYRGLAAARSERLGC